MIKNDSGLNTMNETLQVGQWINENCRAVSLVGDLAVIEIIPGPYSEVNHVRYCIRVGRNDYLGEPLQRALFDTQREAEEFAAAYGKCQAILTSQ